MHRDDALDIRPVAMVIDCGVIGSAVAVALHRAGFAVVLLDEADPPWAQRGMAFTDAWYVGSAGLEEVRAVFCANPRSIPTVLDRQHAIATTTWSWHGIATALRPLVLVDARGREGRKPGVSLADMPDGVFAVGVGPGFVVGDHVHAVVAPCGPPGGDHDECCVRAPYTGRFMTSRCIGDRVRAGEEVGRIGEWQALAPVAGVLRGVTARGARPHPGCVVVNVDPRAEVGLCFGIEPQARRIADSVVAVLERQLAPGEAGAVGRGRSTRSPGASGRNRLV